MKAAIILNVDNQSAIWAAKAQVPTKRSKYIYIRYHHIIEPKHMPTTVLQVDALTKILGTTRYIQHRDKLKVILPPRTIPTAVGVS